MINLRSPVEKRRNYIRVNDVYRIKTIPSPLAIADSLRDNSNFGPEAVQPPMIGICDAYEADFRGSNINLDAFRMRNDRRREQFLRHTSRHWPSSWQRH